jgi:hypothetical protein
MGARADRSEVGGVAWSSACLSGQLDDVIEVQFTAGYWMA